ncbi:hypothetical protein HYC85_004567 [Camellia sinensis]|uniref:Nucleoside diphosphate kinase n=1 Tax=Camellia sinensis TaxID=4442 RepID=A0A7J7HWW3_CAMSI|nr:hypothetical protein HYC85_004567 [Camellia sinensis]
MEALAVYGGSPACASSSSLFRSSAADRRRSKNSLSHNLNLRFNHHNLAAFHSPSHLFSHSPSRPHTLKNTHIFLPHLIASMEQVEETYVMVKPDGVQRGLVGEVISRFEKKGFKLTALKLFQCPKELAEYSRALQGSQVQVILPQTDQLHYLWSRCVYGTLGYCVLAKAWEGVGAVASARKLIGATNPLQAEPGTIRGDLAVQMGRNVVHGSDSPENGKREIGEVFDALMSIIELNSAQNISGLRKVNCVNGHRLKHHGWWSDLLTIL